MFFRCNVCLQKDNHIDSLEAQIRFLQGMLQPQYNQAFGIETNKILEGAGMPVIEIPEPTESQNKENIELEREAIAILTGNYYEGTNS